MLLLGVKLVREVPLPSGVRPRLAIVTLALAIASSILMAALYHPSLDPSRVYYGTDTRASELLFGAALAMVWPSRKLSPRIGAGARNMLDGLGVARPGGDRADDLAAEPVLLVPLSRRLRAALDLHRAGRRGRWRTRPAGSARSSAGGRCAGSACAPTASTSGTFRSSSSPPPAASPTAPNRCASCSRWRRSSPPRRSPGATSRSRSATAPSVASGGDGAPASGGRRA